MNRFFIVFLSMSVSGSLLILALMLARPFFRERISKRWQYYIWLVVIARLLLPFTPRVSLVGSLLWQTGQEAIYGEEYWTGITEGSESDFREAENDYLLNGDLTTPVMDGETNVGAVILKNLWAIWLVVTAVFLLRKITIYQSFVKYVKAGCMEVSDVILLDRMAEIGEQVGVRRPVELYTNHLVSSPMLLGFLRPCMVLPDADLPENEFRYTLWHELIHDKRQDMLYKWLMQITICLHWFNPLVYWMGREMNRSCELSLDEAIIGSLDEQGMRDYGDTLLHAMGKGGNYHDPLASVTLGESAELLKERLKAIMKYKKYSKGMKLISFILTFIVMAGAIAAGAYASPSGQGNVSDPQDKGTFEGLVSQSAAYAEQCYQEKKLAQFMMFYILLSESEQKNWLEKSYEDGQIAFFSAGINKLDSNSMLIQYFAGKAYEDSSVSFFSVLADRMSGSELEAWLSRAVNDQKTSFQAVILNADGKDQELEELEEKMEAQRLEEYQAYGITKEGMAYYYQGQLVGVLLDLRQDSSFVALDMNPEGEVNIRITRDGSDGIKEIKYMTEEEVEELFGCN